MKSEKKSAKKSAKKSEKKSAKNVKSVRKLNRKLGEGTDAYGFRVNSRPALLIAALQKKPMTMKEVTQLPWNEFHVTQYCVWGAIEKKGVGKIVDGKMTITKKGAKKSMRKAA